MLLGVINAKNIDQMDIIYFEFLIDLLDRDDGVFTDASANTVVPPNFFSDPQDLSCLNWQVIDSLKWSEPNDTLHHQRMAETLVCGGLPLNAAARCIVWNSSIKEKVEKVVAESGGAFPPIEFESRAHRHY